MDKNIIDVLLDQKESQFFDCKRVKIDPAKVLEIIVAFANADGGTLVLGMDDPDRVARKDRLIGGGAVIAIRWL